MQETKLEVGAIFEGKVTGITKFGAFVDLGNGKTGMVHISEVAPVFVKEIRDFVTEGQTVKVKIIGINEDGKISLSTAVGLFNGVCNVILLVLANWGSRKATESSLF